MTRLLTSGYETGDILEAGTSVIGAGGSLAPVTATPTPRSGNYALKALHITGAAWNATNQRYPLSPAKSEVWIRFGFYIHTVAGSSEFSFASLLDSTPSFTTCLNFNPSTNLIIARQNAGTGGVVLASSSLQMTADAWHVIDWRCQITSATVGTIEVWLDGTRVINFSGDVTSSSGTTIATVALGNVSTVSLPSAGTYLVYDDIAINDINGTINNGRIGDGCVYLLKPSGAGSSTALTRGGTDSGANWSQVDELPPSMTDYVYSATAGTRDLYALEDVPAGSWTVNCCEVLAYGQNNDTGTGSLGLTVKSGATTSEGTAQNLAMSAQYVRQLYETDPATSTAWTVAAVSALEAGTTVR